MRDDLRDYATAALGDTDAVLVVDETGSSPAYTQTRSEVPRRSIRPR